jgi:two-component system response regulator VanR
MRVLIVEDEPLMAEAIRDGLRLEAIAADIADDGDIPGPTGDEIAERIVASGSGMPILMLTAADRLDDKATGFELGADDYLTKPGQGRYPPAPAAPAPAPGVSDGAPSAFP